jgi:hypothetical protein
MSDGQFLAYYSSMFNLACSTFGSRVIKKSRLKSRLSRTFSFSGFPRLEKFTAASAFRGTTVQVSFVQEQENKFPRYKLGCSWRAA